MKRTQRARELADSGEIVPGSPVPSEASLPNITAHGGIASMFTPDKFRIYDWELPWPSDFTDLSERHRRWKAKTDRVQRDEDIDDGSDGTYVPRQEIRSKSYG